MYEYTGTIKNSQPASEESPSTVDTRIHLRLEQLARLVEVQARQIKRLEADIETLRYLQNKRA